MIRMYYRQWSILTVLSAVTFMIGVCSAVAAEIEYPVAAYTGDTLTKVRQWEKTWAGKKIDGGNVDQVAEFLPESFTKMYKNPDKWGAPAEGLYFNIVPYQRIVETQGMIEATKKNAALVKTNNDGTIANYADLSGIPYPAPKTGLEIAWNFDFNNHGDSSHYKRNSPNINPKSRSERFGDQEQWELFFIHRTELDPRPKLTNNPKGYHRGLFIHMWGPPEFINTRYYSMRYIDPTKDDTMYMWYAQFRRIRRMSTKQRADAVDGTDLIYDDEFFWDGHIMRNSYKLTGTKELLCSRHQDMGKISRAKGQVVPNNLDLERTNLLVVEAINKDPDYVYGKRVWYVCPETYIIRWSEIYDQLGRFWKTFMMFTSDEKTQTGAVKNFIVGYSLIDFQRTHGGFNIQDIQGISIDINPNMFTVNNLQKTY